MPRSSVLVEPTSAVDAHTEARIARQLHRFRAGVTTVVVSTSPLVLDQADTVVLIADGVVQAAGKHRELLRTHPAYKDVVTRGEAGISTDPPDRGHRRDAEAGAGAGAGATAGRWSASSILHALAAATGLVSSLYPRLPRPGPTDEH